jgi:hypothetical protein
MTRRLKQETHEMSSTDQSLNIGELNKELDFRYALTSHGMMLVEIAKPGERGSGRATEKGEIIEAPKTRHLADITTAVPAGGIQDLQTHIMRLQENLPNSIHVVTREEEKRRFPNNHLSPYGLEKRWELM